MTTIQNEPGQTAISNRSEIQVLKLALPMAITQLITMGSSFLCMTMLAKLGHDVLAASALIFSISISSLVIFSSLLFSLSILVSHAYGRKDYLQVGSLLQQGWMLGFLMSIPTFFIFWNIYPILIFFGQEKTIALIVKEYFHANVWRILPFFLAVCNQQVCYGVHKQKIDLFANVLGVIVLLVSAYVLIFGKLGLPALGVAGFGYATALQGWFYLTFTTFCLYYLPYFKKFTLFHLRIHQQLHTLKHLFKIGWPISLQISGEMLSFVVTTMFIGWLGIISLAAYQVIMQYQFLILIPIFAISQASGVLVGQALSSQQFKDVRKLGQASIRIVAILSVIMGLMFIGFPKLFASIYLNVNDPGNANTMHLLRSLFVVVAFSQFFDATRNVVTGCLRGLLDTKFPMIIGLLSIWLVGIPLGYLFGFTFHWGAIGVTLGWLVGMALGAVLLYYRWRKLSLQY